MSDNDQQSAARGCAWGFALSVALYCIIALAVGIWRMWNG